MTPHVTIYDLSALALHNQNANPAYLYDGAYFALSKAFGSV